MHWLLRIGTGEHFIASSQKKIWEINSKNKCNNSSFLKNATFNDILWFIISGNKGQIIACATFKEFKKREIGPLFSLTETNEELGWNTTQGDWDTEVHYENLLNLSHCNLLTNIKSPRTIRKYNPLKCAIDLPKEYEKIISYLSIKNSMIYKNSPMFSQMPLQYHLPH